MRDKIISIMEVHGLDKRDMLRKLLLRDGSWRNVMRKGNDKSVMWQRAFVEGYELGRSSVECSKKNRDADAS